MTIWLTVELLIFVSMKNSWRKLCTWKENLESCLNKLFEIEGIEKNLWRPPPFQKKPIWTRKRLKAEEKRQHTPQLNTIYHRAVCNWFVFSQGPYINAWSSRCRLEELHCPASIYFPTVAGFCCLCFLEKISQILSDFLRGVLLPILLLSPCFCHLKPLRWEKSNEDVYICTQVYVLVEKFWTSRNKETHKMSILFWRSGFNLILVKFKLNAIIV